jgi:hypothetical protein
MAVVAEVVNEVLKVVDGGDTDFEDEGVFAEDAVTLVDFADALYDSDEAVFLGRDDAYEGHDGQTYALRVDFGVIADDDSGILHAVNTVGHARRGEAHALAKFAIDQSGVLLQQAQEFESDMIE